jgi:hypothetical protein
MIAQWKDFNFMLLAMENLMMPNGCWERHAMLLITFSLLSPNMKGCKFDEQ